MASPWLVVVQVGQGEAEYYQALACSDQTANSLPLGSTKGGRHREVRQGAHYGAAMLAHLAWVASISAL